VYVSLVWYGNLTHFERGEQMPLVYVLGYAKWVYPRRSLIPACLGGPQMVVGPMAEPSGPFVD
jgi:hypothetical protein